MKMMKKIFIAGLFAVAGALSATAQVKDISVAVSPRVSYNWWNENIALNNSPFYGATVGFGVGPFLELRGTFEKSANIKNALEGKKWNPFNADQLQRLEGMNIDVTRFGGEVKLNLLNGFAVAPFVTVGAGVQKLDYNPFKSDAESLDSFISEARAKESQLYVSAGAGLKFNLTERLAFSLEGKNIRFNMDPNNGFLSPDASKEAKRWGNWSAVASLDFYLGGSTVTTDQRDLYSDGFRGMKFVLEPGVLYTDFSDKLAGRTDGWYMGGSAGLDFGSLIGIRGFYYQATQVPNKLDFNFNKDQKIYGAKLITRLNQPRGIVPYLQLGAGYIDDNNFIESKGEQAFKTHNLFALAGAGVELPLSRFFALFGTANAMLMADNNVNIQKLSHPTDVVTSLAYTAGLRINLGVPASVPSYNDRATSEDEEINSRTTAMREEKKDAQKKEDTTVSEEKKEEESSKATVQKTFFGKKEAKKCPAVDRSQMMTKKEFEEMVDRILGKIRAEEARRASSFSESDMDVVRAALSLQQERMSATANTSNESDALLLQEIRNLRNDINRSNNSQVRVITQSGATTSTTHVVPAMPVARADHHALESGKSSRVSEQYLKLNRLAPLTGINLGEGIQWMIGARGYMQIADTNLDFVPEVMLGFGTSNAFDLSANVVYNIPWSWKSFRPYAGLGLGFYGHGMGTSFGVNTILGTTFASSKNGEFFADYSIRQLFRNNQITVGYRFVF